MLKSLRIYCLLFLSLFAAHAFAESSIVSVNSFTEVQQMIAAAPHPHRLLVALDDDDTLTMMPCAPYSVGTPAGICQYLGGPAWFSWQQSLAANDPNRVWSNFDQLLAIQNALFATNAMPLDDPAIPDALKTAGEIGAHVIVASARGYNMSNATEAQFSQDGIMNTIESLAIHAKPHSKHISFPGTYMPKPWSDKPVRAISYQHGVLYLAGQNKGVMLQQFLKKTREKHRIREIIFVDDTMQNVTDVAAAYKNDPHVNAICVHYTRLEAHKNALVAGKDAKTLQATATAQWKNVDAAMKTNMPGYLF